MPFIFILLLSLSAYAEVCEPAITIKAESSIVLKEGHRQEQSMSGVYVEMDRYCPGETVRVAVYLRSGTAELDKHFVGDEINYAVIPPGHISGHVWFAVVGDNDWNEDRTFSVHASNPTHGYIRISTVDFVIKNDDPQITLVVDEQVTEPRQGSKPVSLAVKLSMPAEQRITGEVEFREKDAIRGVDFEAPFTHGFEILPGESEYQFLSNTLTIYSDDEKENKETLRLFLNGVKNATPSNESALIFFNDPKNYQISFTSKVEATSEGRVALTSNYNVSGDLTIETKDGVLQTKDLTPRYSHIAPAIPGPVQVSPGKVRISATLVDDSLVRLRFEFVESPFEIYPYITQRMFMYMSSFAKLHEDEFITIHNPGNSEYPAFDFQEIVPTAEGEWHGNYVRRLSEDGIEVLRERTNIVLKELK